MPNCIHIGRKYVEDAGKTSFSALIMTVTELICMRLWLAQQLFVEICYTDFRENPTNGLPAETRSQRTDGLTGGRGIHIMLYFIQRIERLKLL
jgi:hypothetical protein